MGVARSDDELTIEILQIGIRVVDRERLIAQHLAQAVLTGNTVIKPSARSTEPSGCIPNNSTGPRLGPGEYGDR